MMHGQENIKLCYNLLTHVCSLQKKKKSSCYWFYADSATELRSKTCNNGGSQ